MPVAGKTPREVEAQLVKLLGANYLQNPQVSVDVREYNSQRVTVGGLNDVADSTLLVFRRTDGKRTAAKFDIDAIRSGNAKDPELKAGDVIVVNDSVTKKTFENFSKALPLARFFLLF